MELNLLSVSIAMSTGSSIFVYWAFAKNKWFKTAYISMALNGSLLIWINWALAAPNRVPEISLSGVTWTSDTSAMHIFSILCVWMIVSGFRGLKRLKDEAM